MNTMNDTKNSKSVVSPSPKKWGWREARIKNREGVVVKRPSEEEPLVSDEVEVKEEEEEEEQEVVIPVVDEEGITVVEEKVSKDGI